MTRYAKTMSQALAEVQVRELKMNDPKLMKVFDKLKPRDTVKIKHSSTLERGKDFIEYTVRSKNTLRNGVEKITLARKDSPTSVKRFLYKRDNKVTFAVGDMAASIDAIKEEVIDELVIEEVATEMAYKPGKMKDTRPQEKTAKALDQLIKTGGIDKKEFQKARQLYVQASDAASREKLKKYIYNLDTSPTEALMDIIGRNDPDTFMKMYPNSKEGQLLSTISYAHRNVKAEEVELDEMKMTHVLINMQGKVQGYTSNEKDAKEMARRTKSTIHPIKKPITDKTLEKMNALAKTPKELKDLGIIEEVELNELHPRLMKNMDDDNLKSYYLAFARDPIKMAPQDREIFKALTPEIKKRKIKFSKSEQDLIKKAMKSAKNPNMYEEVELDEKYDLYHKSFSDAMQHAYDYAKKKLGIIVDPKEIDDKVATGPKKPSVGKTNRYRLKGKGGNLQIQVYNKGGSKPFELNMYKEELDKEDEPKVKEIIKKLKGASKAHAGQAKDLEKAVSENSKGKEMSEEKLTDGNLSLKETVLKMWQEAKSPEQQAAIAIAKKEKEKKEEPDEGNLFTKALKDARDKGEKTFTVAGKTYDVKSEKLVGGQKKLDKDKDGDIDAKDFALLRKSKKKEQKEEFSWPEYERYLETKKGSLRDSILKVWGENVEEGYKPIKANHYDVKVTVNDKDVAKVKKIISNFKGDIEDVDSDQVDGGGMKFKGTGDIFIQGDDAGKLGMEIAKAVRTAKVMGEDKDLTKNEKHGKNKMTDTGKEMTPVDMAPKMPKIKNEKNKV